MRALFYILFALLPLSTELPIGNSLSLDFPFEPILIILSFITILFICYTPKYFYTVLQSPLLLIISAQMVWWLINIIFSTTPLLSVKFFLAKCWYIIPFCILLPLVIQEKKHWTTLATCLCISMSIMIILAIVRHASFQFSFIGINKSLYPFFRNHVNYSALLVCLFPTGYIFLKASAPKSKLRLGISTLLVTALFGLILAYSRGAWIALLVGILAYWLIKKGMIRGAITFSAIAIFISIFLIVQNQRFLSFKPKHDQTYFHEKLNEHLAATVTLEDVSNGERIYRWIAGAYMVANKPITGFGTNSFYPTYKAYTLPAYETWVSNNPDHSTVHNYFLLIAIEQGLPGLCLFTLLIVYMFVYCQKVYTNSSNPFHKQLAIVSGTTLAMILFLNFFSDLLETDKIGGIFWLICSVVISLQLHTNLSVKQRSNNE